MSPRHTFGDLIHERTNFDFVGRAWRWALLSGMVVVVCLLALAIRGLNLGIEFEGGTSWRFEVSGKSPSVGDVRDTIRPLGLADAKVQILGGDSVRVQAEELPADEQRRVTEALAGYGGIAPDQVSVNTVGPTWGKQVSEKALRALVVFLLVLAAYLSFRLDWKMAVAMIIAMLHDIIVTAGVYSIGGFEVTPATVVALLTILGFSLYDSVVVFDKVRENAAALGTVRGDTYSQMVNRSMNQVLMRSLNTSLTAVLPVLSLLVIGDWLFGAVALRDFALALLVGILTGTYSSIFVAVPIVAWWKEREPRYRALRERSTAAATRPPATVPEPIPVGAPERPAPSVPAPAAAAAPSRPTRPPRPRQQRRRKRR
ncbi:MAG: protein translocase subunit SecF [Acidimicrobiia bacterium]